MVRIIPISPSNSLTHVSQMELFPDHGLSVTFGMESFGVCGAISIPQEMQLDGRLVETIRKDRMRFFS